MVAGKRGGSKAGSAGRAGASPTHTSRAGSAGAEVEAAHTAAPSAAEVTEAAPVGPMPPPPPLKRMAQRRRATRKAAAPMEPLNVQEGLSVADSLLQALIEGASVVSTADALLSIYRDSSAEVACCAVLNLVGKAAGVAQVELDSSALREDADINASLEEMYARVPVDSSVYYLVNKDTKYRMFRRTYPEFFERLVELSYTANALLDGMLLQTLLQWLIAMSESKARCFRHTASVALLGIVQGLNKLIETLNGRIALLRVKQQITELQENINDIAGWRDHVFSQVIHQRLRDVAPEIRLVVFQYLKDWILEFPSEFVANKYLRYFGMPLHDKRPEIRMEGLSMILEALARTPDGRNRMFLFLQYFANRLVEMSSDVDVRCADLAIRVVALMVRADSEAADGNELVSNEMIDRVLLALFDERPTIRTAAGVLLKVFLHCRTSGEDDASAQTRAGTELLCAFAATLRAQHGESAPERYLIDALWTPERPPTLLCEYGPIVSFAMSGDAVEAAVGLSLAAALLERLRAGRRVEFGPPPRDDRSRTAPRNSAAGNGGGGGGGPKSSSTAAAGRVEAAAAALRQALSRDMAAALVAALSRHRGDVSVLTAAAAHVAAMDLAALSAPSGEESAHDLCALLRAATVTMPHNGDGDDDGRRAQVAAAWDALVRGDHPLRSRAEGELHEVQRAVVEQIAAMEPPQARIASRRKNPTTTAAESEADALHVWGRASLVASLSSFGDQWGVVKAALVDRAGSHASPEVLRLILATAVRCILWELRNALEEGDKGAEEEQNESIRNHKAVAKTDAQELVRQRIGELLSCIFRMWTVNAPLHEPAWLTLATDSFTALCDLCALPHYAMSQTEQEVLVERFVAVSEALAIAVRTAQDSLKAAVHKFREESTAGTALADVVQCRRTLSRHEAAMMRGTAGIARLFVLNRLTEDVAPRVLLLWTGSPSKAVSMVYKSLFHALRDRSNESFVLEKSVLLAAYNHCVEVGATPASVEALYQIGLKLSSLHFLMMDKYYPACVSIVRFGVQFAITTDPMILQAVMAYCSKLRQQDAIELAKSLATNEMFATGNNPFVRSFVASLRRAARLEDATSSATPSRSMKRPRTSTVSQSNDEDNVIAAILQGHEENSSSGAPSPSKSRSRRTPRAQQQQQQQQQQPRVVRADGWRVRPEDVPALSVEAPAAPVPKAASEGHHSGHGGQVQSQSLSQAGIPGTQETTLSSLAAGLDNNEVFIATQEYD